MLLRHLICFVVILLPVFMLAQDLSYDLSQYKARYERRPGLSFFGQASLSGAYDESRAANNGFGINSNSAGFLNRNTDNLVVTNALASELRFSVGSTSPNFPGNPPSTSSSYTSGFRIATDRLHNKPGSQKFWGWGSSFSATQRGNNTPNTLASSNLAIAPSLSRGTGRIEFAEDALLATWMMQDLRAANIIDHFTNEDVERLARTITDIIGNRVFDLRRRRIYELRQLNQALLETRLVGEESFDLFAILNDNWAFANRAVLQHGSRFRYGFQGIADGEIQRDEERDNNRLVALSGGVFAEYEHHRIVARNNGSHGMGARVDLLHLFQGSQIADADFGVNRQWWQANLSLFYRRVWLPNSRSRLSWMNELLFNEPISSNVGSLPSNSLNFNRTSLRSTLFVDYFLTYNWTIRINANLRTEQLQNPDRFTLAHAISFSTRYFLF